MDYSALHHPIIILIRGLPGSGKSYLATRLQTAIGGDSTVALDPDAINYDSDEYRTHVQQQNAEGVDPKLHAYRFSRNRAYAGIEQNKVVIWNQPFTNFEIFEKMVDRLQTHAAECNTSAPILVVDVEIDPEIARQRVVDRKQQGGHGPSADTFDRFVREYSGATAQGYNTLVVRGTDDVAATTARILGEISKLAA